MRLVRWKLIPIRMHLCRSVYIYDADALNSSGITRLHNHPYLKLQGEGTVIAVIDSGIDYLNPIFRNGDVSRIAYIWDQTIPGNEDEQVPYGKVFTGEEINQALLSENPQEIVPSLDENGHGTAMAGLAAGNFVPTENFSGAAPKATIIVVKLKKAKILSEEKFYQYPATGTGISGRRHYAGISLQ